MKCKIFEKWKFDYALSTASKSWADYKNNPIWYALYIYIYIYIYITVYGCHYLTWLVWDWPNVVQFWVCSISVIELLYTTATTTTTTTTKNNNNNNNIYIYIYIYIIFIYIYYLIPWMFICDKWFHAVLLQQTSGRRHETNKQTKKNNNFSSHFSSNCWFVIPCVFLCYFWSL